MRNQAAVEMGTDTEREERNQGLANRYVPWSAEEDDLLRKLVEEYGPRYWTTIAQKMPNRNSKSCRLRWVNQLRDDLKKGGFSPEEDEAIIRGHLQFGNRWTLIAKELPGRTDNAIKNRWHSTLRKRLAQQAELRQQLVSAAGIAEMAAQPQAAQLLHHLAATVQHNPQEAAELQALLASMSGAAPTSSGNGTSGHGASTAEAAAQAAPQLLGAIAARAGLMLEPAVSAAASSVKQPQLLAQLQGILQQAGVLHNPVAGVQPAHGEPLAVNPTGQAAGSSTTAESAADVIMAPAPAAAAASAVTTVTSCDHADASSGQRRTHKRPRSASELAGEKCGEGKIAASDKGTAGSKHQAPHRQGSTGSTDGGLTTLRPAAAPPAPPPAPPSAPEQATAAAATGQTQAYPSSPHTTMAALLHSLTPEQLVWLAQMKHAAQAQGTTIPADSQAGAPSNPTAPASSVSTSSGNTEGLAAKRLKRDPCTDVTAVHAAVANAPHAAQLAQLHLAQQQMAVLAAQGGAGANPMATSVLTQLATVGLQALLAAQQQAQHMQQAQHAQMVAAQQQALQASMLQAYLQRVSEQRSNVGNLTAPTACCAPAVPAMVPAASSSMEPPARFAKHVESVELDDAAAGPAVSPRINTVTALELPTDLQLSQFCFEMDAGELLGSFNTPLGSFSDLTALIGDGKACESDAPLTFTLPQSSPNLQLEQQEPMIIDTGAADKHTTSLFVDFGDAMPQGAVLEPYPRPPLPPSLPAVDTLVDTLAVAPPPPILAPAKADAPHETEAPEPRASSPGRKALSTPAAAPSQATTVSSPHKARKQSAAAAAAMQPTYTGPVTRRSADLQSKPLDVPFGAACAFFGHHQAGSITTGGESSSCATSALVRQNSFAFAGLSHAAKDSLSLSSKLATASTLERAGSATLLKRSLPAASRDVSFTSRSMAPADPTEMLCGATATAALLMGVGRRTARELGSTRPVEYPPGSPVPPWLAKAQPAAPLGLGMFESFMADAFVSAAQHGATSMD